MVEKQTTKETGSEKDAHEHISPGLSKTILSLDNLGIFASVLCLIHCLAMPFLVAMLPFLGLQFLDSHESHVILGCLIIAFALFAIVPGYLKHKKVNILLGMILGIGLVLVGSFLSEFMSSNIMEYELPIVIVGNLILVTTHIFNMKHINSCCEH